MGLFKKKNDMEIILDDKEFIQTNLNKLDVLLEIAKEDDEICASLKEIQEKIKYCSPSKDKAVIKMDEKVGNKLDDLKIAISRAERRDKLSSVTDDVKNLHVLFAERNAKL